MEERLICCGEAGMTGGKDEAPAREVMDKALSIAGDWETLEADSG